MNALTCPAPGIKALASAGTRDSGRTIEIEAYTPGETIGRGTRVRVIRVQDRNMLFVEPIIRLTP